MIDLKKTGLPESIEVEGGLYYIQTSFKYWLRFLELLEEYKIEIEKNGKIRYNGVLKGMVKSNVEIILSYWNKKNRESKKENL